MRALLPIVALALVTPACSLLGLDNLPQATCMPGSSGDLFCADLAGIQPTNDACLTWQCGDESMHCEALPLDADSDGAPSMTCAPAGEPADCDDADFANRPRTDAETTCDGADNDCDGLADEGLVRDADLLALRVLPTGSSEPVFARAPDADESAIAVLTSSDVSVVLDRTSALLVSSTVRTMSGTAVVPTGISSMVGLGMNRYAILFEIAGGTCPRLVLGNLDTSAMTIRVADAHAPVGFPNTAGDCTMGATSTGGLGRDGASRDLLVAYLESAGRDCGVTTGAPVLVVGAPDGIPAAGLVPLELGESVDPGPPAILSLGSNAFLVAFPTADGAIEVHRVTLAADGTASGTLALTLPGDAGGLRGDVRLTAGTTDAGTTEVALTYAYGCGMAPVALQLLDVTATAVTAGARIAGTAPTGARHAVAVHQPMLDEWLLAWRTRMSLGGIRVDGDGGAIGDGFALSSTTGGYETSLALVSPGRVAGYRALSVRTDAGTPSAVAIELGCLPLTSSP